VVAGATLREYLSVIGFDERPWIEDCYRAAKAGPD